MVDSQRPFDPGWAGLEREPLVFLDLEATGAMPGDRIVEIGAVLVQEDEILDSFQTLVNPEVEVPEPIRKIHGIGDRELSTAPPVKEALSAFFEFLGRARGLGAHHAPADMRFLAYDARRAGLPLPGLPMVDTKVMARRMLGRSSPASLSALCDSYGITTESMHRALPDAMCTHRLFRCLLSDAEEKQSRYWTWPRPMSLGEASLSDERLPEIWQDLEPRSPPHRMEIQYGNGGGSEDWIEIWPLALVEGRRGPWLRAREAVSGSFKFYQLRKVCDLREPGRMGGGAEPD